MDINSLDRQQLEALIDGSFKHWTGIALGYPSLYNAEWPILAHNGGEDPVFIYANHTAQRLWEMDWNTFTSTPSRLSAEPDERSTRQALLTQAKTSGIINNYEGIRISATGKRFQISDVSLWNLVHENSTIGQAAIIRKWHFI